MSHQALVIANGELPSADTLQELLAEYPLIIAADGAADQALARGIRPDIVVGDLDSVTPDGKGRVAQVVEVRDQNRTDLEKAVEVAIQRGARTITIVGATGGRLDHTFANLSVLKTFAGTADVRLRDDRFDVRHAGDGCTLDVPAGTMVSLVANGTARGVTTGGLRWNLDGVDLAFGTRGIHNEVVRPPVTIRVEFGDLFVFVSRDRPDPARTATRLAGTPAAPRAVPQGPPPGPGSRAGARRGRGRAPR